MVGIGHAGVGHDSWERADDEPAFFPGCCRTGGSPRVEEMAEAAGGFVRAGRPRSRGVFIP